MTKDGLTNDEARAIESVIARYPVSRRSAILPVLHLIRHHERFIPDEAIPWVPDNGGSGYGQLFPSCARGRAVTFSARA